MEIAKFTDGFEGLPKQVQEQVLEYIEFLVKKYQTKNKKQRKLSFNWEDGLSDLKNNFTSVGLQHKANELR